MFRFLLPAGALFLASVVLPVSASASSNGPQCVLQPGNSSYALGIWSPPGGRGAQDCSDLYWNHGWTEFQRGGPFTMDPRILGYSQVCEVDFADGTSWGIFVSPYSSSTLARGLCPGPGPNYTVSYS